MTQDFYMDFFKKTVKTGRKIRRLARANLLKIDYTFEEFDILKTIKNDQQVNASELAANTGRHKSNVIPILNSFEEKGFIIRKKDKTDRRNIWISLTKAGEGEKERVLKFQREYINSLLSGIDDDILKSMSDNYEKILDYLEKVNNGS